MSGAKLSKRQAHVLRYLAQNGVLTPDSLRIEGSACWRCARSSARGWVKCEMVASQDENDLWRSEPGWTLIGVDDSE